jgi:hypothetical protein
MLLGPLCAGGRADGLFMIWSEVLAPEVLDQLEQPHVVARLVQRQMKRAVQVLEALRVVLDLDLLLDVPSAENVLLLKAWHGKQQRLTFYQRADRYEVTPSLSGGSDNLDTAISPQRHHAGRTEDLDRHANRLSADPEPRRQRVLPQRRSRP